MKVRVIAEDNLKGCKTKPDQTITTENNDNKYKKYNNKIYI